MKRIAQLVAVTLAPAVAVTVAALLTLPSWGAAAVRSNPDHFLPRVLAVKADPSPSLVFEAIGGSASIPVNFLARGAGYAAFLRPTGAILVLDDGRPERTIVTMRPVGASEDAPVVPEGELARATSSRGGPARASADTRSYARLRYLDVYPGIDLVYYGRSNHLEYDFVVAAGADPGQIRLSFEGAARVEIDAGGDLIGSTAAGLLRQPPPVVYQEIDGARRGVAGNYLLDTEGRVTFRLGAYDTSRPLVIDPVLTYSTYLGGSNEESDAWYGAVFGIAVDAAGNTYVTGTTRSADFPTTPGADRTLGGEQDVFVTKFSPTGAVVYSTYLGGPCDDVARAIAVDAAGNAYVTGRANGGFCPLGVEPGVLVAKLGPDGALIYYFVFGGSIADVSIGQGIAVDAQGNAYVAGMADSNSRDFPTTPGAYRTEPCDWIYSWETADGFVAKINAAGNALVYSTYLCGSANDSPNGIAIDAAGNAYVAGSTFSSDFPTVNAWQTSARSYGVTGFVSKLSADGAHLVYSTYLGGSDTDVIEALAVDGQGNVYVTGETSSIDFPTTAGVVQEQPGDRIYCITHPCTDAFVTKLDPSGSALVYSTYLFGESDDTGTAIAVDGSGNAYVVGTTDSRYFPILDAFQPALGGTYDAFVVKLNPDGTRLVYSSYLGGTHSGASLITGWDGATAVAVDAAGNAYVAGYTQSDDFPTTPGAFQPNIGPGVCDVIGTPCRDGVVAKITADGPGVVSPLRVDVTPVQVTPGGTLTGTWAGVSTPTADDVLRLYTLGSLAGPGYQLASWSTGALSAGSLPLSLPAALPSGNYELRLLTPDPNAFGALTVIARSQPIHVAAAAPDLVIATIATTPAQPSPGQPVAVDITVTNQGMAAAGGFAIDFYKDRAAAPGLAVSGDLRCPIASLAASASTHCTGTVTYGTTGTFSAWAQVDTDQAVAESNEGNNVFGPRSITIVAGSADLVEIAVTNPPPAARPGTSFTVTDTVKNQGGLTAGASTTRYYLSSDGEKNFGDKLLTGSHPVASLVPGATATKTVTVTIPSTARVGTYRLLACADDTKAVAESDEGNNCLASTGAITVALPDLAQQSVSNPGGPVRRGTAFTVSDTVANDSPVATPKPTTTRYYLSRDTVRNTGDVRLTGSRTVPILAASAVSSGSVSVTIPSTVPPNTYFVLACADDGKVVAEANEANNCRVSATPMAVTE